MKAFSLQSGQSTPDRRRGLRWLGFGLLAPLLAIIAATGCNQGQPKEQEKKAPDVVVTTPITDEVTDYQDFTGRLDGLRTVDIKARVSGYVQLAPFKEGDEVKEGDLLFLIDPRPYKATLNQAEANLRLAEADRNLQDKNVRRAKQMGRDNSIAREDYDTMVAAGEKAHATVGSAQAMRDLAQLNLDYTRVIAPHNGRISRRFVDPGNLVNADNTILTTLVRDDQLYAYFDVDERTYLDLVGPEKPTQGSWITGLRFPVLMRLANEEAFARTGMVDFVDNRVNGNTGTIRMRAVFENPHASLRAGLFVRIRLPIGKPYRAILIPDEALQSDQGRKYLFVVNDKSEAVYRPVDLGQEIQGLRVIKTGLAMGERVIVNGMQRVRTGVRVQTKDQEPVKPPGSTLGKLLAALPAKETKKPADQKITKADKETTGQSSESGRPTR
jgi:RND family efflux transporter MFP subunit